MSLAYGTIGADTATMNHSNNSRSRHNPPSPFSARSYREAMGPGYQAHVIGDSHPGEPQPPKSAIRSYRIPRRPYLRTLAHTWSRLARKDIVERSSMPAVPSRIAACDPEIVNLGCNCD